ncbi:MAG: hypothetical protein JNL08_05730 [Planctomycetes bacterium]|nr:hypothetical protein [Planctomycetota bacterium]
MSQPAPFSPDERDRLEQELLELHFGCHEHPEALAARIAGDPRLQALQREVLAQAAVLERAVQPEQAPLDLAPPVRRAWWQRPVPRLLAAAAAAASVVLVCFARERIAAARCTTFDREHLHLTVSAPKAVPAGAPWSFTVQAKDLNGDDATCRVRWQAFGAGDAVLAAGEAPVTNGSAAVALPADLRTAQRVEVIAAHATDEVRQVLTLEQAAAGPLVHVSTDRPVYRPGEPVYVRAVVLDRVTLLPRQTGLTMRAELLDAKDAPVAVQSGADHGVGAGSFVLTVPATSQGGTHRVQVAADDGRFPPESVEIVVRPFQVPRLDTQLVLDRASYAPGSRGGATVRVARLGDGGGAPAGALATGTLVVDGTTVSSEKKALDARGEATFRFTVPTEVARGAARFVATIEDGGNVESQVRPFVVPTGELAVACFPEGGDLVAAVPNRVYIEITDPLGRAIDATGELVDDRGERLARFSTEHRGRARIEFTPRDGRRYELRLPGQTKAFALPAVQPRGIALRALADASPAGEPLRLGVRGRGDGPWLLGVFCRGVLVGQTTLRAGDDGELQATAEVPLPDHVSGVLRATVFDRTLQPVAERLLRRANKQRIDIAVLPQHAQLVPGEAQRVVLRATDERGEPVQSLLGVSVTDQAVVSLGSEPRVGLADQASLFADVERVEELGDFLLAHDGSARNADLLLGTRGWRRYVWRNDAAAQATIAARGPAGVGVLAREGFSHTPQVHSNLAAAQAAGATFDRDARAAARRLEAATVLAGLALLLLVLVETIAAALRAVTHWPPVLQTFTGVLGAAAVLLLGAALLPNVLGNRDLAPAAAELRDFDGGAGDIGALVPPPDRAVFHEDRWGDLDSFDNVTTVTERKESAFDSGAWNRAVSLGGRRSDSAPQDLPPATLETGFVGRDDGPPARPALPARERQYAHRHTADAVRDDFAPLLLWQTLVRTDERGEATVGFATSDAVTTWLVQVDAHALGGTTGRVGQGRGTFTTALPFHLDVKLPDELSAGDELQLPIAATATGQPVAEVALQVQVGQGLRLGAETPTAIQLDAATQPARGRALVPLGAAPGAGTATLLLRGSVGRFDDTVRHTLQVTPRGFPHHRSFAGTVTAGTPATVTVTLPADAVAGSGSVLLKLFPSPLAALTEGLDGILREPHGCFEQASSSNYPNTMVLSLLEANGDDVPLVAARARELLPKGYAKITGYECARRGYEWFGNDPGHEALTAYGLLQFHDMQRVHDVDATMVERTRQWLLDRRDGKGNYPHQGDDHHSFGGRSVPLTNAYVTYALLQSGTPAAQLATEVDALVARATTGDPYELALIACALHLADRAEATAARERLAALQQPDGSLHGTTTSITMSGGRDLVVETTGFAALAWLPAAPHAVQARRAIEFLQGARDARGTFGATQATIVALRALTAYAQQHRAQRQAGTLRVWRGDALLAERAFAADEHAALTCELWDRLAPGDTALRLELEGGGAALPWAVDVAYHSEQPADDPDAKVALRTSLRQTTVREGDPVAIDVALTNRTDASLPMTLAIIGLPAGLELPTRVLEDLQRAEAFAFWELRGRDLVLYWRDLEPGAERRLALDAIARIPGRSTGPASRAYLYYTAEQKRWAAPLAVEVTPR